MTCRGSGRRRSCNRKKKKRCFRSPKLYHRIKDIFGGCGKNMCDVTLYRYKNGKGVKDRRRCKKGQYWACGVHNVTGQTMCACR